MTPTMIAFLILGLPIPGLSPYFAIQGLIAWMIQNAQHISQLLR